MAEELFKKTGFVIPLTVPVKYPVRFANKNKKMEKMNISFHSQVVRTFPPSRHPSPRDHSLGKSEKKTYLPLLTYGLTLSAN
jgi:hypothetical protein